MGVLPRCASICVWGQAQGTSQQFILEIQISQEEMSVGILDKLATDHGAKHLSKQSTHDRSKSSGHPDEQEKAPMVTFTFSLAFRERTSHFRYMIFLL